MSVDRNEKIWAYSNTGTRAHAFVQAWKDNGWSQSGNHLRAMCRGTIARHENSLFYSKSDMAGICTRCETLATAVWDRAEASMQPATEAQDLGYEAHAEVVETQQPDWDAVDEALDSPDVMDALHAEALAIDASGEDQLTISHREAMGSFDGLKPGDVFHKTVRRYAGSRWVDAPIIVTVLELTQIKDIWSGKTGLGVRFDMHDGLEDRTSRHQLLLQGFLTVWVR